MQVCACRNLKGGGKHPQAVEPSRTDDPQKERERLRAMNSGLKAGCEAQRDCGELTKQSSSPAAEEL